MKNLTLKIVPEPDPVESYHQEMIFRLAELNRSQYPELEYLHAVPNGGYRHKATAVAMQRQGVKRGVEDMQLAVPRGGYFGLFIELKRFRAGEVSDDQQRFLDFHSRQGYRALVCWGWRAAWAEITGYLSLPPTEVLYQ